MSASALVTGSLFRKPEQRLSKAGRPYATAKLRVKAGEATDWWNVTAFSETAQAELMRLNEGDAISIQGALKVETYDKNCETKLSLSIVADQVLALRQPPKQRERKPTETATAVDRHPESGARSFDDEIPF